jgi:hypothetical protein
MIRWCANREVRLRLRLLRLFGEVLGLSPAELSSLSTAATPCSSCVNVNLRRFACNDRASIVDRKHYHGQLPVFVLCLFSFVHISCRDRERSNLFSGKVFCVLSCPESWKLFQKIDLFDFNVRPTIRQNKRAFSIGFDLI